MEDSLLFGLIYKEIPFGLINASVIPSKLKNLYSSLGDKVGGLYYLENQDIVNKDRLQVLTFTNSKNILYVLKRNVISCLENDLKGILANPETKYFFEENIKDLQISKLVSCHPAGVLPIGFQFIKLTNLAELVSEYLMEYAGTTLSSIIPPTLIEPSLYDISFILKVMKNTSNVMAYIEKLRIIYSDLKAENFLIDKANKVRIIDFNVSQEGGFGVSVTIKDTNKMLGYSTGYTSPELLNNFVNTKKKKDCIQTIDPWKSDVYSWGILCLILFRKIGNNDAAKKEIEKLKNDKTTHKKILDYVSTISLTDKKSLIEKVQILLTTCLDYDADQRIYFKTISQIMEKIEGIPKNELQVLIDEGKKIKLVTKKDLYDKITLLETEITELKDKNTKLEGEKSLLQQSKNQLNRNIDNVLGSVQKIINEYPNLYYSLNNLDDIPELLNNALKTLEEKTRIKNPAECLICAKIHSFESEKMNILSKKNVRKEIEDLIGPLHHSWILRNKNLSKDEIKYVISMVYDSTKVKIIDFGYNQEFDDACCCFLLDSIRNNYTLHSIVLFKNKISIEARLCFTNVFRIKNNIQYLLIEKDAKLEKELIAKSKDLDIIYSQQGEYNVMDETEFEDELISLSESPDSQLNNISLLVRKN